MFTNQHRIEILGRITNEKNKLLILLASALILAKGCTTSTYGDGLQPISGSESDCILKIYTGGFYGGAIADKAAEEEIRRLMNQTGYASYEVLERRHNLVPSYFEYVIKFEDKPISGYKDE